MIYGLSLSTVCALSQGHPSGERSTAMSRTRSYTFIFSSDCPVYKLSVIAAVLLNRGASPDGAAAYGRARHVVGRSAVTVRNGADFRPPFNDTGETMKNQYETPSPNKNLIFFYLYDIFNQFCFKVLDESPDAYQNLIIASHFFVLCSPSLAQDFIPSPSAEIDPMTDTSMESAFPAIRKEFYNYDETWFPFLLSLTERNKTDALRILESLHTAKFNYGDKNASFYSYALLALSGQQEKEGDIETAARLIDESILPFPGYPPSLLLTRRHFIWRNEPGRLYDIVHHTVTGLKLSLKDITIVTTLERQSRPRPNYRDPGDILPSFPLCLAAKYAYLAAKTSGNDSDGTFRSSSFQLFIAVFFIFLLSLDIGLLWLVILMNVAFLVYYTKTEKDLFGLFYILILVCPIILNYTSALMLSTHRDVTDEIVQIKAGYLHPGDRNGPDRWVAANPDDISALFALGSLNKRTGYLDYAQRYYGKIIEIDPTCAPALNNLGAIHFILRDYPRAEELFIRGQCCRSGSGRALL